MGHRGFRIDLFIHPLNTFFWKIVSWDLSWHWFLDLTSEAKATMKNKQLGLHQTKSHRYSKGNLQSSTHWTDSILKRKKIFAKYLTDKCLKSTILKDSYNSITQKQIAVTRWAEFRLDIVPKKTHRGPTNTWGDVHHHLSPVKCKSKPKMMSPVSC